MSIQFLKLIYVSKMGFVIRTVQTIYVKIMEVKNLEQVMRELFGKGDIIAIANIFLR